jgi:hypothetical protein
VTTSYRVTLEQGKVVQIDQVKDPISTLYFWTIIVQFSDIRWAQSGCGLDPCPLLAAKVASVTLNITENGHKLSFS